MSTSPAAYMYDDFEDNPDPSHRKALLQPVLHYLAHLPSNAAVLDAGCGGGDFTEGLAEAGRRMFGMDMSESGIAAAKLRKCGEFRLASVYENLAAPFNRTGFDAIIAIEVIEHLYSPRTFVRQAREVLPKDGVLIITTPYWGYFKNIFMAVTNRIDRALTAKWEGGHIKHFSRKALTELLEENGFKVSSFEGVLHHRRINIKVPGLWSGMIMVARRT